MESYEELRQQKEAYDKFLLRLEAVLGYISTVSFLAFVFAASYIEMPYIVRIILIVTGSIILAFGIGNAVKIEQMAGYYECGNCHHKHIPTYKSVFFASHIGRTRYLKCPECNKKSWHKKVLK